MTYFLSQRKGFALLLGVVIAGVLISVTYAMFSISLKQIILSIAGKNSQMAFYAADSGAECALYADTKGGDQAFVIIPTPSIDSNGNVTIGALTSPGATSTRCSVGSTTGIINYTPAAGTVTVGSTTYSSMNSTLTIYSPSYSTLPTCSIVTVSKYKVTQNINGRSIDFVKTKIHSQGYNTCVNLTDPQRLERGLDVFY